MKTCLSNRLPLETLEQLGFEIPAWVRQKRLRSAPLVFCGLCGCFFPLYKKPTLRVSGILTCSKKCRVELVALIRPAPQNPARANYMKKWTRKKKYAQALSNRSA